MKAFVNNSGYQKKKANRRENIKKKKWNTSSLFQKIIKSLRNEKKNKR